MKFNIFKKNLPAIINYEGAKAYRVTPEMELYSAVVTTSLSNQFYESGEDKLKRIISLISKVKPEFVARLAIYAREKMYLRTIPLVLVNELAKVHRGDSLISKTTQRVIQRADEITELLAYYQLANQREGVKKLNRLSKQLQKGLAAAFNKFDEYQFAKYNRKTEITFKDVLFLTHPKAKDETQQALFKKIIEGELEVPYTWEVELSRLGQQTFKNEKAKQKAVKEKWSELINSNRLGYMALMRNLRNILQAGVGNKTLRQVAMKLSSQAEVRRAKQLPFRYLAAYNELRKLDITGVSVLLDALEEAVRHSAANIKGFGLKTRVLLAADVSGSMYQSISNKSKIQCYDIGLMLSMLMRYRSKNVVTGIFGDIWKRKQFSGKNVLSNVQQLRRIEGSVGYATNGHKVIEDLIRKKQVMDKVMFFTDCQMWNSGKGRLSLHQSWKTYKNTVAPKAKLYLFDLAGYGNTPLKINKSDVFLIAGWSDKIFDVLDAIEKGGNAIEMIHNLEI